MPDQQFTQTTIGAIFVAVVAGLMVWFLTTPRASPPPVPQPISQPPPNINPTPHKDPNVGGANPSLGKWLGDLEYQQEFERQLARRYYPSKVEGRLNEGQEQYRAEWEPWPTGPFDFVSHHRMTPEDYERKNQLYLANRFSLLDVKQFVDVSGITRYQAIWVKKD